MEEWIDEDVAVMMDSDEKPWKATLKGADARSGAAETWKFRFENLELGENTF